MPATGAVEEVLDDALGEVPESTAPRDPPPEEARRGVRPRAARRPRRRAAPEPPPAPEARAARRRSRCARSMRTRFVPIRRSPPSERSPGEAGRLLGEAEIFLKHGLRLEGDGPHHARGGARARRARGFSRVRDFHAALNDGNGVFRFPAARGAARGSRPGGGRQEVARARGRPDNAPRLRPSTSASHGAAPSPRCPSTTAGRGRGRAGSTRPTSTCATSCRRPRPRRTSTRASRRRWATATTPRRRPRSAPRRSTATTRARTPAGVRGGGSPEIPGRGGTDHGARAVVLPGGRREIEEGLDEAEFFVTQGSTTTRGWRSRERSRCTRTTRSCSSARRRSSSSRRCTPPATRAATSYGLADKIAEEVENLNPSDGPTTGQIDVRDGARAVQAGRRPHGEHRGLRHALRPRHRLQGDGPARRRDRGVQDRHDEPRAAVHRRR